MKHLLLALLFIVSVSTLYAQKYQTRNGYVKFFSKALLENIEASTNQASCLVDIQTGEVLAKILVSSFVFEKALMQEHFNENYMESDKYPQAQLKALISSPIDYNSTEKQGLQLKGELTVHGVTKPVVIDGSIVKKNEKYEAVALFVIKPSDYKIKIPKTVINNIAKEIEVSVRFEMEPVKR